MVLDMDQELVTEVDTEVAMEDLLDTVVDLVRIFDLYFFLQSFKVQT